MCARTLRWLHLPAGPTDRATFHALTPELEPMRTSVLSSFDLMLGKSPLAFSLPDFLHRVLVRLTTFEAGEREKPGPGWGRCGLCCAVRPHSF